MNATRRQYIYIGAEFPERVGDYLRRLEENCKWDLRLDNIYVSHSSTTYGYEDVRSMISSGISPGGQVIPETFDLYYLFNVR